MALAFWRQELVADIVVLLSEGPTKVRYLTLCLTILSVRVFLSVFPDTFYLHRDETVVFVLHATCRDAGQRAGGPGGASRGGHRL